MCLTRLCMLEQLIIKWKDRDKFDNIVLRMGAFDMTCTLLAIIERWFQDAGLHDFGIETGIVAEGSAASVLEGHMYNRGVRFHKLIYESIFQLAWKWFIS